jgi:uncharacterized protein with gpF-like domain
MRQPRPRTIAPVRPNIGIEMAYRRRIERLVEAMHRSLMKWVLAAYRAHEPLALVVAQDARLPSSALVRAMRKLGDQWLKRFAELAPKMAEHFAIAVTNRTSGAMAAMLKQGGMSVKFQTTPLIQDAMTAAIGENVSLIKSIAQQHLTRVQGAVMRSAQVGNDVGTLAKELAEGYGITQHRAKLIARDQSSKMTAVINKTRQTELGIKQAIWKHSGGGRVPRPEHVGWTGKVYDVEKGMWSAVDQAWVWPGTAISCRCVCKSIIPGLPIA